MFTNYFVYKLPNFILKNSFSFNILKDLSLNEYDFLFSATSKGIMNKDFAFSLNLLSRKRSIISLLHDGFYFYLNEFIYLMSTTGKFLS